uniref:Eukaryotic translation initiation factor 2-alpha kinase 2 n=1 Tax=Sparus aurata TaxID=8175 RepID=A0A671VI40_SPAAU
METGNYVARLNEYAQKTRCGLVQYEELDPVGPDHDRIFTQRAVLNGKVYPDGVGRNKKEAKQNAAKNALERLMKNLLPEAQTAPVHQTSITQGKYVCWLNEYSQKNRVAIKAVETTKPGTNSSTHWCRFVVGDEEYPDVSGKTKKDAKEEAAKLVYDIISGTSTQPIRESNGSDSEHSVNLDRFTSEYNPMECLGSGTFGCVYKARDKVLKRDFAVKIVRWEEKSLREVKTLSDLSHPNIIRYYTFWMEDSGYIIQSFVCSYLPRSADNSSAKYLYIQMELCDTETLKKWIKQKNTRSPQDSNRQEESLNITQQIVTGVEYIHSMNEACKKASFPANILFGLDRKVKIGDFGLVTRDDDDDLRERTLFTGTPSYMAPEQIKRNYDRKVDIFPLGLMYFELLWKLSTGHKSEQIIKSMLCEQPEDRPEASTLRAELEKWAQTMSTQKMLQANATN